MRLLGALGVLAALTAAPAAAAAQTPGDPAVQAPGGPAAQAPGDPAAQAPSDAAPGDPATPAPSEATPADPDADDPAADAPDVEIAPPSRAHGATIAQIVAPTFARRRLTSARRGSVVSTQTSWSGQPQALLVLDARTVDGREWLKVLLPRRPNGSTGWIPREKVQLSRTRYWVSVRVRTRRVTVYREGRVVRRMRAVVGAPATPTPRGLAAIYERNRQPNPRDFVGPWVLSLTSLSNVLDNYGGGPGRVAIHGRAGASFNDPLGSARSHGCVRIDNRHVSWLAARLPQGTPVDVG